MKKRFILLDDQFAASPVNSHSSWSSMIDYSGSAPGGLLFAVYFSPGGNAGLFSSCSTQGFVTTPGALALESSVCSFSGNVGIEICWLEQAWAVAKDSAKAAGFVVLLGVGGVLCYRWLYSMHRKFIVRGIRTSLCPMSFEMEQDSGDVGEEIEEDLFDLFEVDISVGLNCLATDHRPKRKIGKGLYIADQIRTRWRHVACRRKQTQKKEAGFHRLPLRQSYSTPDGLVKLKDSQYPLHKPAQDERPFVHQSNESFSGCSSLEVSPKRSHRLRSHSLSVKDPYSQCEGVSWSLWDCSVESFVSGASEVSRLIRECSVDSDCSDFSLDLPFNAGCSSNTLEVIERIEQEINSVKNNCLAMNHELYTLHDVHPTVITSGSSEIDLSGINMELAPLHLSQSSFKGMLNLTAIPDEIGDAASNSSDFSPSHLQLSLISGSDEDGVSMEWDNLDLQPSNHYRQKNLNVENSMLFTDQELLPTACTALPICGNLLEVKNVDHVWCSQESGYLEWDSATPGSDASTSFTSASILSPLQEKRESDSMSCTTTSSYSSCLTSPDDSSHEDSIAGSGVVKRRQWAKSSQQNRDSVISDLGIDLEAAWTEEAVGTTVLLHHYAQDTWQAPTPRAQTIKQAYIELERLTECRKMRKMRGDNYGILRATLCQMVMKKISCPRASEAIDAIDRELAHGGEWIKQWTFGHRLPYGRNNNNVIQGIHLCLETLDRLMEDLTNENDPLEALVSRLNASNVLDTQLMEALKLHMLSAALNLNLADSIGDSLPLFALGLFSRPDSKNAKGLAINYLNPIGDSVSLQRAEYYLLGFALHARIDLYRPTIMDIGDGQENVDLRTSYPEFESSKNLISIIEEDERHYSVPVP